MFRLWQLSSWPGFNFCMKSTYCWLPWLIVMKGELNYGLWHLKVPPTAVPKSWRIMCAAIPQIPSTNGWRNMTERPIIWPDLQTLSIPMQSCIHGMKRSPGGNSDPAPHPTRHIKSIANVQVEQVARGQRWKCIVRVHVCPHHLWGVSKHTTPIKPVRHDGSRLCPPYITNGSRIFWILSIWMI